MTMKKKAISHPRLREALSLSDGCIALKMVIWELMKTQTRLKVVEEKLMKKESKGQKKVHKVMHEFHEGKLHSGSKKGPEVKPRKQAIAIALSEARKSGAKIPKKK